jgi:hypothetical protein
VNTIYWQGIRIDEPVVTLTDLVVSAACFYFAWRLYRQGKKGKVHTYFQLYFFIMGLATAFGGIIGHAFIYALPFAWKLVGWIISMISIMMIERAAIEHTKLVFRPGILQALRWINVVEFITFLGLTIYTLDFWFVQFHSGYGLMFVVLSLEGYLYYKTRNTASGNMLIGCFFAAIAAIFFIYHISPHQWFNYICMSHLWMTIAAWFFWRGAMQVEMER